MPAPQPVAVLDHALALAARGFRPIFIHAPTADGCSCGRTSCPSRGKHPVLKAWQRAATSDSAMLRDQYASVREQLGIEPNLGIALGYFGERYAIAIDVDDEERFLKLSDSLGALPATLTGHSARGARMFFVLPPGAQTDRIKNVTALTLNDERGGDSRLRLPGVDVKVKGGQVVVAPSRHESGAIYSWMDPSAEVAELPTAWVLAIQEPVPLPKWTEQYTPQTIRADAKMLKRAERYVESALHREAVLVANAAEGGRNSALHHAACAIFPLVQGMGVGALHGAVVRELMVAAHACGLSEIEARRTIASAERWQQSTGAVRVPHLVTDVPHEPSSSPADDAPLLAEPDDVELLEDQGRPAPVAGNVARMLERYPRGVLRYDAFADRVVWPDGTQLRDHDPVEIQTWLFSQPVSQRVRASLETIWAGAVHAAMQREFHPVRDYLGALPAWDRIPRVDSFFVRYFGAPDSAKMRGYARCFLLGAVARVMTPGCQLDTMPVLEGAQGIRKSTAIRTLAGDWFSDTPIPDRAPDCYQQLRGVWLYELAELAAIKGREVERIKAYISSRVDRYRRSYGRGVGDVLRQVAFVGTTNASTYLTDDTGNRRYQPVPCGRIDLAALRADRDQLWAEARERWANGEPWWLSDELAVEQAADAEARTSHDPWSDAIATLPADVTGVTARDLLVRFGLEVGTQTKSDEMRLAGLLKRAGWWSDQVRRNGTKARFWFRPSDDGTVGTVGT